MRVLSSLRVAVTPYTSRGKTVAILAVLLVGTAVFPYTSASALGTSVPDTWTAVSNPQFSTNAVQAIAYGDGTFVAVGANGKAARSTDGGVSWTTENVGLSTDSLVGIAYGDGVFMA